jgi:hypothetical protein
MRRQHTYGHPSRGQSSDRGELPLVARDIALRTSSTNLPTREPTRDPIYDETWSQKVES